MFTFCDGYSRDHLTTERKIPLPEYPPNEHDNDLIDTEEFEVL